MYKIMTKLHTSAENVYAFHMTTNDNNEVVEYKVTTPEEAAETALELLGRVGYEDLRIVDDQSYYLDLIYGKKPTPVEELYNLLFLGYPSNNKITVELEPIPEITDEDDEVVEEPEVLQIPNTPEEEYLLKVEDIKENATVNVKVTFEKPVQSFHLIIDNKEYKTGFPKWVMYEEYTENSCRLTFTGITRDHKIEIVVDDPTFVEPPRPTELQYHHTPEALAVIKEEYYEKYPNQTITPDDDKLYLEIAEAEEVSEIKLNTELYDTTEKTISIGNNGKIKMPVFKFVDGKLYVSLLHMIAEANNNKVAISCGKEIFHVSFDNAPLNYKLNIINASGFNTMVEEETLNEVTLSGTTITQKSNDGRNLIAVDIAANGDIINEPDAVMYRLDQNKNIGITSTEEIDGQRYTYAVYLRFKNGEYTAEDAGEYKSKYKIIIAGKGVIEINFKLIAIAA